MSKNPITLFYRQENRLTEVTWPLKGWSQDWNWDPSCGCSTCTGNLWAPCFLVPQLFPALPAARATPQTLLVKAVPALPSHCWKEGDGQEGLGLPAVATMDCPGSHTPKVGWAAGSEGSAPQVTLQRVRPAPGLLLPSSRRGVGAMWEMPAGPRLFLGCGKMVRKLFLYNVQIELSPFLPSWRTLAFSDWLIHNRQVFYYVKSAAS